MSFFASQSRPCTKPITFVTGLRALFKIGAGCGRQRGTSSRQPVSCRNDQNVAVPAWGAELLVGELDWMDRPPLSNWIFSATVW